MIDIIFISFRFYSLKLCIIQNKNKNIWQSAVINECSFSNLHLMKGNILDTKLCRQHNECIKLFDSFGSWKFFWHWLETAFSSTYMCFCRSCGKEKIRKQRFFNLIDRRNHNFWNLSLNKLLMVEFSSVSLHSPKKFHCIFPDDVNRERIFIVDWRLRHCWPVWRAKNSVIEMTIIKNICQMKYFSDMWF